MRIHEATSAFSRNMGIFSVALFALTLVAFRVDETERAVVLQMGRPVRDITAAGLHLKWPWPYQSVQFLEKRWILYDSDPREVYTADKKTMVTDTFSLFRIKNGISYLQNTITEESAQSRVDDIVYSEMRNLLGAHTFDQVLVTHRDSIMDAVTEVSNRKLDEYGLETGVVRMNRVDLPQDNKTSVALRMSAERHRMATGYRSEGEEQAKRIRAETDKDVQLILADAEETARRTRGEGDAMATAILTAAYSKDPAFFRLWRGLTAAERTLSGNNVRYILKGDEPHIRAALGMK